MPTDRAANRYWGARSQRATNRAATAPAPQTIAAAAAAAKALEPPNHAAIGPAMANTAVTAMPRATAWTTAPRPRKLFHRVAISPCLIRRLMRTSGLLQVPEANQCRHKAQDCSQNHKQPFCAQPLVEPIPKTGRYEQFQRNCGGPRRPLHGHCKRRAIIALFSHGGAPVGHPLGKIGNIFPAFAPVNGPTGAAADFRAWPAWRPTKGCPTSAAVATTNHQAVPSVQQSGPRSH